MAYAHALSEFADAGGYDVEVTWDVCTIAALALPYDRAKYRTLQHALRRRAEAAGARAPAARARRGAAARRARQLPRRARQDLARAAGPRVGQDDPDDQPRPRAAQQHRDPGGHGRARWRGQHGLDPPGRLRVVPRGAPRPVPALRGAAQALGRGARQAQAAGAALQDQVRVQRRHGLAVPRRPDPAAQVRGGRPANRAAARAAGDHAPHRRPHRQARGRLREPRADRADEALRPRGLVRRAGGRARLQRLRQVALPPPAGGGRQRPGRRAPPGRRRRRSSPCSTRARPSSVRGCGRAGSCRPTSTPS